jgi:hypothetical protein
MFAEKGIARTHAKWSAVATASYRLMPHIIPDAALVRGELADELVAKCPMKVFDIESLAGACPSLRAVNFISLLRWVAFLDSCYFVFSSYKVKPLTFF